MSLDPVLWKPRFTVVYNQQQIAAFTLRWMLTSRLTRIDCIPLRPIKDSWNKGGDLDRLSDGVKVGRTRYIPWGSSYQVWPADIFYPFNLKWKPVPWFPQGRVQFWEYTGIISDSDLLDYMQLDDSNPNADLTIQLEMLRQQMAIFNPGGVTTKEKLTDFLQTDANNREMVPANPERNGGIIFNKGTKALWVGFGVNAEKSSPNKVLPGGQIDIPESFVGVINGLFDAANPAPSAKAIVEEMVAA
jgi:hypothetical protein